jgi:sortase A
LKKHLPTIILITVFIIGLSLLLYPTVSDYINSRHQSRAVTSYEEGIADLTAEDFSACRQAAEQYNASLLSASDRFLETADRKKAYDELLNPLGNSIMGYIEIKAISVKLPIYHGTDDAVMQVGVGHIEGSSLPVGGAGTHCVLSGHSGLPSTKLFTNLSRLREGDVFKLHVLDQVLVYQVDKITVVEPADTKDLKIVDGMDYCTLVTCTPYGINSHRLLVRGVRIESDQSDRALVTADAVEIDPLLIVPVLAAFLLTALFIWLFLNTNAKRKRKGR